MLQSSDDLIALGSYRVAANRGGGWLHAFLARRVVPAASMGRATLPSDDIETQHQRHLTRAELVSALVRGEIGEIKWAGTAALALLHEMH